MATTTKLVASNGLYGNNGNNSFTNSGATHLYVGKYGSEAFRSRLTFQSLKSAANIGNARIVITSAILYLRRNTGGPTAVTAGCSSSSSWNASLAASGSATISAETKWQTIDVTSCASAIADYTGNWYIHLRASAAYVRFNGTGSDWKPYLMVTWEYVAATITSNSNNVTLGNSVKFTITPEVSGETHTLQYYIGDASGTIVTKGGNSISWTPPVSLATEITDDDMGMIEIRLTAYDSSGNVQRTERYYQTVTVPDSVKPAINSVGASLKNGLNGYGLTGRSYVTIAPVINMNNDYAATIISIAVQIVNGSVVQEFNWSTISETSAGIFTGASSTFAVFTVAGTATITLTVTDSRGRSVTSTQTFTVCQYAKPVISAFSVERYEPVYDANEAISGYQASELGTKVWVNLSASISKIAPAGTQLNTLKWTIQAVNVSTGTTSTVSGTGAQSVSISKDRTRFTSTVNSSDAWNYTLTVTDTVGVSSVQYSSVLPARAPIVINNGHVGIGCIPSGSESEPGFHVAYPAEFEAALKGLGGLFGADGYRLDKVIQTANLTISHSSFVDYGVYNTTYAGMYTPRISRVGPLVFLDGMLANKSAITLNATEVTVATLPAWARPRTDIFNLHQGSTYYVWWLRVLPDGKVTISRYRTGTSYSSVNAGAQFPLSACWIAADAF
ncbi:MAG: hypothetical protein J6R18_08120 [Kiritimatiellae bacterium]|nr:hypothetical protein [Kiritimatiellia bacterium]